MVVWSGDMVSSTLSNTSHAVSRIKFKIKNLPKTYVFVPSNKVANNIVVVCRKWYTEVLRDEVHSSNTFQATNFTEEPIVNEHLNVTTS